MEPDNDSTYEGSVTSENLATSVTSSVYKYLEENGQTHHAYKDGEPNGEMKLDRLDLQHQLFHITLGGKLYLSPMTKSPQTVLDIATEDGTWALDFANRYPSSSIVANNLSSARPKTVPPNIVFEVDDANKTWTYSRQFDFIHCRQHHRRIEEHKLFEQGLKFLKPGGWMEMQELCNPLSSDDGTLTENNPLTKWGRLIVEASAKLNRNTDNPTNYASWMREAGFTNVETVVHKWPTNPWPKDEKEKLKGLWNLYNVLERLQEFSTALFTRVLGWSQQEVDAFLVDVRAELQNKNVHAYWPVYIVYGQKPLSAPSGS